MDIYIIYIYIYVYISCLHYIYIYTYISMALHPHHLHPARATASPAVKSQRRNARRTATRATIATARPSASRVQPTASPPWKRCRPAIHCREAGSGGEGGNSFFFGGFLEENKRRT